MLDSDFGQIAAILIIAAAAGGVARLLRQPLIVAFIVVGIAVGPAGLELITADDQVSLLAKVGIAILLFLVGLKLDLHLIRTTGPVALYTGLGQVAFTSIVGFGLALLLGFDTVPALYIAVALTFSSTIIIVKLLSDKRELDELHGRIAVGFLIVQDLVVIIAMIVITASGADASQGVGREIALTVVAAIGFLTAVVLLARYVLPRVLDHFASTPELIVLFGVAWAVALGAVSDAFGLSMEVGAFIAGVSLASTSYREAIGARLVSLRDILILFFFIELGAAMDFSQAASQIGPALALSAFVLIGNPVIVMVIMGLMGYRKRVSFLSGLMVAQISEFSLILVALGLSLGQIDSAVLSLVTVVGVITIGLSTYLILYSKQIYEVLAPALSVFERRVITHDDEPSDGHPFDAIVIGGGRFGNAVMEGLVGHGHRILLVDFDPNALGRWREAGVETLYGDVGEPELIEALPLGESRSVICTVPDRATNEVLMESLARRAFAGSVAVTAHTARDADLLASSCPGATVLQPFDDAAAAAVRQLVFPGPGA